MVLYILTFTFLDCRQEDKRLLPTILIWPHLQRTYSLSLCSNFVLPSYMTSTYT
jgi:hypothetical protein